MQELDLKCFRASKSFESAFTFNSLLEIKYFIDSMLKLAIKDY